MKRPRLYHMLWFVFLAISALLLLVLGRLWGMLDQLPTAQAKLLRTELLLGVGGVLVLGALSVELLSRNLKRHLRRFRDSLQDLQSGRLESSRLPIPEHRELAELATLLRGLLQEREQKLALQKSRSEEQSSLLDGLMEGFVAVDLQFRITRTNKAAARLLHFPYEEAFGRDFREIIRNFRLHKSMEQLIRGESLEETDVQLMVEDEELFLRINGTTLRDAQGLRSGALILFSDITRLQRLETIRRDFVANVSHELKTPITSVKGAVETLLAGALEEPEVARRFLGIAERHADRLNAIIDDLLILSRIEQGEPGKALELSWHQLSNVVHQAVQTCELKAQPKGIQLVEECPDDLQGYINPPLLEQALVNLVDNAIKYSEPDTQVTIRVYREQAHLFLVVQDQGLGIEAKHLERLFERFYRVDKARSRKVGGTGLGLAIVKHIAQAHGGRILVSSLPGKGSRFSLEIPSPLPLSEPLSATPSASYQTAEHTDFPESISS